MVFPVVMYGCESWTVKKAERRRIDAFELWCWGRLLTVPWTARRSNQSILKEISPGISLEGLMLKLKLQYFGHLMPRVDSLGKTLMLGGLGQKEKGMTEDEMAGWHHWLDGHESEWTPGVGDGQGGLACCDSWGCRVGYDWATELNMNHSDKINKIPGGPVVKTSPLLPLQRGRGWIPGWGTKIPQAMWQKREKIQNVANCINNLASSTKKQHEKVKGAVIN